jgi:hypothetical protein
MNALNVRFFKVVLQPSLLQLKMSTWRHSTLGYGSAKRCMFFRLKYNPYKKTVYLKREHSVVEKI